jgi:endonuclease/exonuclease/phosphatase family metal-dependent hydrolase
MVPLLVLCNFLFFCYWLFQGSRNLWLSAFVLVIGYLVLGTFFKFQLSEEPISNGEVSIMSFNARGFNRFEMMKDKTISAQIVDLVKTEDPDIICFQEFDYTKMKNGDFDNYKYSFVDFEYGRKKVVLAIYSKFPIVNTGSLEFPDSANNAIFADVVIQKDTVRLYNLHLESHKVIPSVRRISNEPKAKLYKRMSRSFAKQQEQAAIFNVHRNATPYKKIVCGDFNNTQFSNVYQVIKDDMQDTFLEQGTGYGRTFNFKYYPVRIDFILLDKTFEVKAHKNFDVKLSDHFPLMASFNIGGQ